MKNSVKNVKMKIKKFKKIKWLKNDDYFKF